MAGIAGAFFTNDDTLLGRVLSALSHRGDREQIHRDGLAGQLGVRWFVAAAGAEVDTQGLACEPGVCLAFDGTIANEGELRRDLVDRGHRFLTRSTAEVILRTYQEHDLDCFARLRGTFAIAIFDRGRIVLARDRFGVKPLYYSVGDEVVIASEIKGVLAGKVSRSLDMQALVDRAVVGATVDASTCFRDVRSVKPAHVVVIDRAGESVALRERRYYSLQSFLTPTEISFEAAVDRFGVLIGEAFEANLPRAETVGFTLSGGLDSAVLVLLGHEKGLRPVRTFTVCDSSAPPDFVEAAALAHEVGAVHDGHVFGLADYLRNVVRELLAEEEPAGDGSSCVTYERVARSVRFCIDGDGADALFGGYPLHYWPAPLVARFVVEMNRLRSGGLAPSSWLADLITEASSRGTASLPSFLGSGDLIDRLIQVRHFETLEKSAMASGVDVRLPFLDHPLVEFVCSLPDPLKVRPELGISKYLLRRFALRRFDGVVHHAALRDKVGMPSANARLRRKFSSLCERLLPMDYLARGEANGLFSGKVPSLMFQLFCELFQNGGDVANFDMPEFIAREARLPVARIRAELAP